MRLEVVNGLVGFSGKASESDKADKAILELGKLMNIDTSCGFDNGVDEFMDLSWMYDMDEYTVGQVRELWRDNKKEILNNLNR